MDSLFTKAADLIMNQPEEILMDKDLLIASSIVKALDGFSKINKILLLSRNKPLTDAKIEDVGAEVAKVLFYTACLIHVLEMDVTAFDDDSIRDHTEGYDDIYLNDAIMCSLSGISDLTDLSMHIYDDVQIIDSNGELLEEPPVAGAMSELDEEIGENHYIAGIIASCMILCDRLNLDFGNIKYNAGLTTKI